MRLRAWMVRMDRRGKSVWLLKFTVMKRVRKVKCDSIEIASAAEGRYSLASSQRLDADAPNGPESRQHVQEQHWHVRVRGHVGNEGNGERCGAAEHPLPAAAKVPQQPVVAVLQFLQSKHYFVNLYPIFFC